MELQQNMQETEVVQDQETSVPPLGFEVIRREFMRDKLAIFALVLLISIILISLLSPYFIDVQAGMKVDIFKRFLKPGVDGHILGTDEGGRDVFTMLVAGTQNTLFIGWSVTVITSVVGIALGVISGYYGGVVDDVMMRIVDFIMILPTFMFTIVMITIVEGFSMWKLILLFLYSRGQVLHVCSVQQPYLKQLKIILVLQKRWELATGKLSYLNYYLT